MSKFIYFSLIFVFISCGKEKTKETVVYDSVLKGSDKPYKGKEKSFEEKIAEQFLNAKYYFELEEIKLSMNEKVIDWDLLKNNDQSIAHTFISDLVNMQKDRLNYSAGQYDLIREKLYILIDKKPPLSFFEQPNGLANTAFELRDLKLYQKVDSIYTEEWNRDYCLDRKCKQITNSVREIFSRSSISSDMEYIKKYSILENDTSDFISYLMNQKQIMVDYSPDYKNRKLLLMLIDLYFKSNASFSKMRINLDQLSDKLFKQVYALLTDEKVIIELETNHEIKNQLMTRICENIQTEYDYSAFENTYFNLNLQKEGMILERMIKQFEIPFVPIKNQTSNSKASLALSLLVNSSVKTGDFGFIDFLDKVFHSLDIPDNYKFNIKNFNLKFLIDYYETKIPMSRGEDSDKLWDYFKSYLNKYLTKDKFLFKDPNFKFKSEEKNLYHHFKSKYSYYRYMDKDQRDLERFYDQKLSFYKKFSRWLNNYEDSLTKKPFWGLGF
jgi:hypothetical protein